MRQGARASRPSTPHAPRSPHWLLLLAASLFGFSLLVGVWSWLPPSTVLGVTAQAQAQAHAKPAHASATATATSGASSSSSAASASPHRSSSGEAAAASASSSAATGATAAAASAASGASLAAGRALVRQSQEQLHAQREAARQHKAGSGSGSGSSVSSSGSGGSGARQGRLRGGTMAATTQGQGAAPPASARIVVVGGGLAGLAAALQAAACIAPAANASAAVTCPPAACGAANTTPASNSASTTAPPPGGWAVPVLLVDKMPRLGGNSAKASSGMNALQPEGGDSEELFRGDTEKSGGGKSVPQLVAELVHNSPAAVAFLEAHGVSLPGITRLGGHSVARTRTVTGGANVGWAIVSALTAAVRANPAIRVLEGYSLRRILTSGPGAGPGAGPGPRAVTGVELAPSGPGPDGAPAPGAPPLPLPCGALVLATGGFAANPQLLRAYAPGSPAAALATTNGPWAQGEALALAAEAGAELVGMEDVQIHPTGFVDPSNPDSKTKFLAPEKLRGSGGILLSPQGSRFVDELSTRDVVAGAVGGLQGGWAWLVLGRGAAAEAGQGAVDFYVAKGLMSKADTLAAAAAAMSVPDPNLRATLEAYGRTAAGSEADPYGKAVHPHPPLPDSQLPLYLGRITPVVHYTMGGVAINEAAQALGAGGRPLPGLFAAGEVSGGVHGRNRLGGNSLLECAVFGRTAGAHAAACTAAGAAGAGAGGAAAGGGGGAAEAGAALL
ncbi:hypothetical protein HYH03_004675 [Edaphochlamys debaryana]|uniref:fumarate reductase (NADH) n=1 Tax=Edaphochlamys debaryana TaxID=47281 RepID=A0A835Y9N1_9CHLO|nr:hypothetical protein HYH03_004675 [Edaphochlamys debaryana]|eukprot:KAG2497527.1 hypothetical protein HYH03_004675 [Edaphochlamys debaryana]